MHKNEIQIPEIPKDYTSLGNVWAEVAKSIDESIKAQEKYNKILNND